MYMVLLRKVMLGNDTNAMKERNLNAMVRKEI